MPSSISTRLRGAGAAGSTTGIVEAESAESGSASAVTNWVEVGAALWVEVLPEPNHSSVPSTEIAATSRTIATIAITSAGLVRRLPASGAHWGCPW